MSVKEKPTSSGNDLLFRPEEIEFDKTVFEVQEPPEEMREAVPDLLPDIEISGSFRVDEIEFEDPEAAAEVLSRKTPLPVPETRRESTDSYPSIIVIEQLRGFFADDLFMFLNAVLKRARREEDVSENAKTFARYKQELERDGSIQEYLTMIRIFSEWGFLLNEKELSEYLFRNYFMNVIQTRGWEEVQRILNNIQNVKKLLEATREVAGRSVSRYESELDKLYRGLGLTKDAFPEHKLGLQGLVIPKTVMDGKLRLEGAGILFRCHERGVPGGPYEIMKSWFVKYQEFMADPDNWEKVRKYCCLVIFLERVAAGEISMGVIGVYKSISPEEVDERINGKVPISP